MLKNPFENFEREDWICVGYYAGTFVLGIANAAVSIAISRLPIGTLPKILAIIGNGITGLVEFGNFSEMCGRLANKDHDPYVDDFVKFLISNPEDFGF